jgi:hypothetical protein
MDAITKYENLANAIILQAVADYRDTLARLGRFPYDCDSQRTQIEIERFFRSNWFSALTSIDPEALIKKLRSEVL